MAVTHELETEIGRASLAEGFELGQSWRWLAGNWGRCTVASLALLVPCFWHRIIGADDLGSHTYNAWLASLIHQGKAPGLWIAPQRTNVLFDWLLSGSCGLFGFAAGEKIAVSIATLICFWGLFALVQAATRQAPWLVAPVLAMVTYGWTFYMGFFNFILSLGLAFFALAIVWRGRGWERLIAIPLAGLALMAHPLGFCWLVGAVAYVLIAEALPRRYQWLYQSALCVLAGLSFYAVKHYLRLHYGINPGSTPFWKFNGADQLVTFNDDDYHFPLRALVTFALVAVGIDLIRRRREPRLGRYYAIPAQLYLLAVVSLAILPGAIIFPGPRAAIALLTERLTTVCAALGCCVLGAMRPSKWHLVGSAAIAMVFFAFVYRDTRTISRMEWQAEQLVRTLPAGQRVMATIEPLGDSRVPIQHIIDRACVERCFSYGNYEPGSLDFRVRATPGNPYVLDDYEEAVAMEEGTYVVRPADLPLYQVYQCSDDGTDLCIRPLAAGEENNRTGTYSN
jgi:hypothetical protein